MSRRKLSEQQQRRIQQNQKNRIHSAEANEGEEFGEANGPDRKGLVIARFVRHIDIRISEGFIAAVRIEKQHPVTNK